MSSQKVDKPSTLKAEEIGVRLKAERERYSFSQQQVAERLGLKHKSAVKNYEKGQIPRPNILARYAEIFGRSVEWILTGEDKASKKAKGPQEINVLRFPDPMAGLTPKQRRLVERVMALLDDEKTARHLAGQIDLLEEALENMERKKGSK